MPDINNAIYRLRREEEEKHTEERAKKLGLPYIDLFGYPFVKEVLDFVPEEMAAKYQAIPYLKLGREIKIGVTNTSAEGLSQFLELEQNKFNIHFSQTLISQSSLYYGLMKYEEVKKADLEKKQKENATADSMKTVAITDIKSAAEAAKQANVTTLLDTILVGAARLNASDIHFEPGEDGFLTRYRIDGVLQDVVKLPIPHFKQLSSRIKYLSKLRMDVSDKPQDGRFSFNETGEEIDFRVSIMPSAFGESIVLRLLGQEKSILQLDRLGFRQDALLEIRNAISKPHGMILTSGPTGSGKSSTLYAILMELKKPGVKIITLEDPVEYHIAGIEQSQVQTEQGYGFADGLRASLRQDPDILMVGEIRDPETAEIAVQAALTGHLLLSTIHANSAPAVYVRLLEIGVKPFLLSGSTNLIMAQRLLRKVCPHCQQSYAPSAEVWQSVVSILSPIKNQLQAEVAAKITETPQQLVHGVGCKECNSTGFLGRQVIIEVLTPNETIENLVTRGASIAEFEKIAGSVGMVTMEQDGLIKALLGQTTVEEVWRVTRS